MTEIYSATDVADEVGAILLSAPSPKNRLQAARILGRYDAGSYLVQNALLNGLKDHSSLVRNEVYKALSRMHYDTIEDILPIARSIREALELEDVCTPAWYSGRRALEKLSQQAEPLIMEYKRWDCWDRVRSKFEQ